MPDSERVLDHADAQAYYDRFGKKQDSQGFYEDPAIDALIAHAGFADARSVFEFGCGTGKFADRILENYLPSSARYLGCDISPVMVRLTKDRIEPYGDRAEVIRADGPVQFPLGDHAVDRVVATYVLDLLSEKDIRRFLREARRVLRPGGLLCLASLTHGVTLPSKIVSTVWMNVFRVVPSLVGGCRPLRLESHIDMELWQPLHRQILKPFGVPSEILVLTPKDPSGSVDPSGSADPSGSTDAEDAHPPRG